MPKHTLRNLPISLKIFIFLLFYASVIFRRTGTRDSYYGSKGASSTELSNFLLFAQTMNFITLPFLFTPVNADCEPRDMLDIALPLISKPKEEDRIGIGYFSFNKNINRIQNANKPTTSSETSPSECTDLLPTSTYQYFYNPPSPENKNKPFNKALAYFCSSLDKAEIVKHVEALSTEIAECLSLVTAYNEAYERAGDREEVKGTGEEEAEELEEKEAHEIEDVQELEKQLTQEKENLEEAKAEIQRIEDEIKEINKEREDLNKRTESKKGGDKKKRQKKDIQGDIGKKDNSLKSLQKKQTSASKNEDLIKTRINEIINRFERNKDLLENKATSLEKQLERYQFILDAYTKYSIPDTTSEWWLPLETDKNANSFYVVYYPPQSPSPRAKRRCKISFPDFTSQKQPDTEIFQPGFQAERNSGFSNQVAKNFAYYQLPWEEDSSKKQLSRFEEGASGYTDSEVNLLSYADVWLERLNMLNDFFLLNLLKYGHDQKSLVIYSSFGACQLCKLRMTDFLNKFQKITIKYAFAYSRSDASGQKPTMPYGWLENSKLVAGLVDSALSYPIYRLEPKYITLKVITQRAHVYDAGMMQAKIIKNLDGTIKITPLIDLCFSNNDLISTAQVAPVIGNEVQVTAVSFFNNWLAPPVAARPDDSSSSSSNSAPRRRRHPDKEAVTFKEADDALLALAANEAVATDKTNRHLRHTEDAQEPSMA